MPPSKIGKKMLSGVAAVAIVGGGVGGVGGIGIGGIGVGVGIGGVGKAKKKKPKEIVYKKDTWELNLALLRSFVRQHG